MRPIDSLTKNEKRQNKNNTVAVAVVVAFAFFPSCSVSGHLNRIPFIFIYSIINHFLVVYARRSFFVVSVHIRVRVACNILCSFFNHHKFFASFYRNSFILSETLTHSHRESVWKWRAKEERKEEKKNVQTVKRERIYNRGKKKRKCGRIRYSISALVCAHKF